LPIKKKIKKKEKEKRTAIKFYNTLLLFPHFKPHLSFMSPGHLAAIKLCIILEFYNYLAISSFFYPINSLWH